MLTHDDILNVLRTIDDPEMPISIVDLGIVEKVEVSNQESGIGNPESGVRRQELEGVRVSVEILPTFVGCPALPVIENEIRRRLSALAGVAGVEVHVTYAPAWNVDRITPAGRESLRRHGVSVPQPGEANGAQPPRCPFCGSSAVQEDSAFGPTRCRMIWYCQSCRQPFEHLKHLASPGLIDLSLRRLAAPES